MFKFVNGKVVKIEETLLDQKSLETFQNRVLYVFDGWKHLDIFLAIGAGKYLIERCNELDIKGSGFMEVVELGIEKYQELN